MFTVELLSLIKSAEQLHAEMSAAHSTLGPKLRDLIADLYWLYRESTRYE